MRFLVDEDMPRSTAEALRLAGHLADDVRDVGLRGQSDEAILAYARNHDAIVVTADRGFGNVVRFPPGSPAGIIVMRFPNEVAPAGRNRVLVRALSELEGEDLSSLVVVVEIGRVRIRRP